MWYKVVRWTGIVVSINLALFLLLPQIAAFFVERQIESFGLENVNVEFEYPGLRQTTIPLISFRKNMGSETARLTIRNLTLEYHLHQLATGFIKDVRIQELYLGITGIPAEPPQSPPPKSPAPSVGTPLAFLSKPQPDLPFGQVSLDQATIFREQATGPFRRLSVSGRLRNETGALIGTVTFQGMEGEAYTLHANVNPFGEMKIRLNSPQDSTNPLLDVESVMNVTKDSGMHWQGTMMANLKRATPFLALLMPLGPDLERVNGKVEFQWNGSSTHMESLPGMLRDASTQLHAVVQADVELPTWGSLSEDIVISVSGELDATSTEIRVTFSPTSSVRAHVNPQAVPKIEHLPFSNLLERETVHIQVKDRVPSGMTLNQENPTWTIDGPIHIQYGEDRSPLGMDTTIIRASGQLLDPQSTTVQSQIAVWGTLPILESEPLRAHDVSWMLTGQMKLENQAIHLDLTEESSLKTRGIQWDQGKAKHSSLQFNQPVHVTYDHPLQRWQVKPTTIQLLLPTLHVGEQPISTSTIGLHLQELTTEGKEWKTKGTLKVLNIKTALENVIPPSTNLAIGFEANTLKFQAGLVAETTDKRVRLKGRLTHNLQTHHGTLQATLTPKPFSPSTLTLGRLIKPWKHPFDLTTGQLGVSLDCVWQPTTGGAFQSLAVTRSDVTIALQHIGGYYEKALIQDLNATMTIIANDLKNFSTLAPSRVSVGQVQSGITLHNALFDLNLRMGGGDRLPTIDIENFSADLFGGKISSPRMYVDLTRPPALFTISLRDIQLQKLLELEKQKGLNGTGILDGAIPITLSDESVEIHNGRIEARAPGGVIRFHPQKETTQTLIQSNPQMEIVLQSLRNFHYDVLKAEVNYKADGTLTLATRLEGKNPDLSKTRPLHLNLNVEENIPALLKSLRVIKGIEDTIEEYVQGPHF